MERGREGGMEGGREERCMCERLGVGGACTGRGYTSSKNYSQMHIVSALSVEV